MEPRNRVRATAGAIVLLVAFFYFVTSTITKTTGYFVSDDTINKLTDFEACLNEQDINLYINSADSDKTLREIDAVEYLDYAKIMNCYDDNKDCVANRVMTFPTWIINNKKVEKDISVFELSDNSGCRIN